MTLSFVKQFKLTIYSLIILALFSTKLAYGQATITTNPSKNTIVDALTGSGLTISNPVLERGQATTQIATFSNGLAGAGLEIDHGVLFSTGNAGDDLTTRNVRAVTSNNPTNTGTDANLIAINPSAAFNTVAFSFDIELAPEATGIRIVFQFGSEEYPDYVGSVFNDLFGFFMSGPGIDNGTTPQNLAKMPSNNADISVNSVNGGVVGDQGAEGYDGLNLNQTEYYINNGHRNDGGPNTNPQPGPFPVHIEYNGITKAITRDIGGLVGGGAYRFKVAIADVGDGSYDSGVLLQQIVGLKETDLTIEKTVSNPTPVVGDVVTFDLKATNKDIPEANAVAEVQAIDLLPSGYTFLSATPSKGTYDPTTGLWDIREMAVGAEESLTIRAIVNPTGSYKNLTSIKAFDAIDINQTDNFDEASVSPDSSAPSLSIAKATTETGPVAVGDIIPYTFTVRNTGNVTLTGIRVDDPLLGGLIDNGTITWPVAEGQLAPSEEITLTGSYTVTQADIDTGGNVTNTATVTGNPPTGNPIPAVQSDSVNVPVEDRRPAFKLSITLLSINDEPNLTSYSMVGDVLAYTITVENTGNVTLYNVAIVDSLANFSTHIEALDPGVIRPFSTTYIIGTQDLDNGSVVNAVTANGENLQGNPVSPENPGQGEVVTPFTKSDIIGITFEKSTYVYDGTKKSMSITGTLPAGAYVTYSNNDQTHVGIHKVIATISGSYYNDLELQADLEITPAPLTVRADDQAKVYGQSDPVLTYTVDVDELQLGDDVHVVTGELQRAAGENVGRYSIDTVSLTATNYDITFVGADLEITPAPLTVRADDQSKVYGQADPVLTYTVDADGLQLGDDVHVVTGELTRAAGENVGRYRIDIVSLTATNYDITYIGADLEITPGVRTLSFQTLPEKTYGDVDFAVNAILSSGENIIYTSSDASVAQIVEGVIKIIGAGKTTITVIAPENANYAERPVVSQELIVHKAPQTITLSVPFEVARDAGLVPIKVTSSSGLSISLDVDDPLVATISGSSLQIHRLGTVTVQATQQGNENYLAAEPIQVSVRVLHSTDQAQDSGDPQIGILVHPALSPNGDGINDLLIIEGIRDYPDNRVIIFNRNGMVLWETIGYNNGSIAFHGRSQRGAQLSAGTYFYIVEVKDAGVWKRLKGFFVIRY